MLRVMVVWLGTCRKAAPWLPPSSLRGPGLPQAGLGALRGLWKDLAGLFPGSSPDPTHVLYFIIFCIAQAQYSADTVTRSEHKNAEGQQALEGEIGGGGR